LWDEEYNLQVHCNIKSTIYNYIVILRVQFTITLQSKEYNLQLHCNIKSTIYNYIAI
jgi:hypothetical protein